MFGEGVDARMVTPIARDRTAHKRCSQGVVSARIPSSNAPRTLAGGAAQLRQHRRIPRTNPTPWQVQEPFLV